MGILTYIMKTCPCNEHPLTSHFYIGKLGFTGVYIFFLFLLWNIDRGFSLEPPHWGSSNVYPRSMFRAKIRKISHFFIWNYHFYNPEILQYIARTCLHNDRLFFLFRHKTNMSRNMRNPTFCICKNKDADQLRSNHEVDRRLCFCYLDTS